MILKIIYLSLLFFFIGKLYSIKFNPLENIILGMFLSYFIIIILILNATRYEYIFYFLNFLSIISIIFLTFKNFKNINFNQTFYKEILRSSLLFFPVFLIFGLIFFENILNIIEIPLEAGDALAVWFYKAKFFIYNTGIENIPQANYPNFISSLWSISLFINLDNFNNSRIILPIILFTNLILVYYKILKSFKNYFTNTLFLILTLIFYSLNEFGSNFRYSNSGYADFAVSVFLMTGFTYIFLSFLNNSFSKKDYFFGCLCLGILPSIKNEGLIISAAIFFILNFIFFMNFNEVYKKNMRSILYNTLIYFIILISPIIIFKYLNSIIIDEPSAIENYFSISNILNFQLIIERVPLITKYFIRSLAENILIILVLLPLFIYNLIVSKKLNILVQLSILLGLFCLIYIFSIYFATKSDLKWHLVTSINRIFFPFTGVMVSLCYLFNNYNEKKNSF